MANWYDRYKTEKILLQQEAQHNKFWAAHCDTTTNTVYVRWGRLGTKGQSQTKSFPSLYQATNFIETKFREKHRKGYTDQHNGKTIDASTFEKLATEAAIIGSSNKCHNLQWVEVIPDGSRTEIRFIDEVRLFSPDCHPGLYIALETRKDYGGQHVFKILLTGDNPCVLSGNVSQTKGSMTGVLTVVGKQHPLYELVEKLQDAVGRSL